MAGEEGGPGARVEVGEGEVTLEVEEKEGVKVEDEAKDIVSKPEVQAVAVSSEAVVKLSDELLSNYGGQETPLQETAVKNVDQVPKVEDVEVSMEEAATSVRELLDSLEARVEGVRRALQIDEGQVSH